MYPSKPLRDSADLSSLTQRVLGRLALKFENFNCIQRRAIFGYSAAIGQHSDISVEGRIENNSGCRQSVTIGNHSYIRGRLLTYAHGGKIRIGDWCYIGVRSEIWSMDSITIGDRVLIAHDVNIHDGTGHSLDPIARHLHFKQIIEHGHPNSWDEVPGISAAPIIIEDDVWISFGVTILKGVRIGKGSVIAADSMVTTDVPPYSLYMCKVQPVITPLP